MTVFELKLLTQTDLPAGAMAMVAPSPAGGATRIGGPTLWRVRTSIRLTVPASASAAKIEPPAAANEAGFPPTWTMSPAVAGVRASRRTTSPFSLSEYQTLPPATTTPVGRPPTSMRVIPREVGSMRRSSPASVAVTQRKPAPAVRPVVRPEESRSGGAVGASVFGSRRSRVAGCASTAQRCSPLKTRRSTGPSNARRTRMRPVRQSRATRWRPPSLAWRRCCTEAISLSPTRVT